MNSASMLAVALAVCTALHLPTQASEGSDAPLNDPATPVSDEAEADKLPPPTGDGILESTRRTVRSSAEWLARTVDSAFGDKLFSEGGKVSNGRVDLNSHKRQGENRELNLRFGAGFRLPNLEERARLVVGSDDQRDLVTDSPQAFSQQQRLLETRPTDRSLFAGIKLPLLDVFEFRLGLRGGLKPFAQMRYEQSWKPTDADVIEFRETLFWTVDEYFGSTTVGSYAHAFSPTLVGRWLNSATITRTRSQFEWNSSLGAYQALGEQRVLSIEALLSGVQGSGVPVSDYGLQTGWEQPIYLTWLLGEIRIGHFWPRKDPASERGRAWAAGAGLKLKF
jgi:hypothetical protein